MSIIVGRLQPPDEYVGNLGSDAYQFDKFRHFDSASSQADVCQRATDAWETFYSIMRRAITPIDPPEYNHVAGIARALSAFGMLTHSLQDFYAHSNWIEIHIDRGQLPGTIDGLFPTPCDMTTWPHNLQTGYFDLATGFIDGCPLWGETPPEPFRYCHELLNKDNDESRQGGKTVPGLTITYHKLAMELAAAHTAKLYQVVASSLERDLARDFPNVRADCLVRHVFQGSTEPCRFGQLTISNASAAVTLGQGVVEIMSQSGQALASYSISSWPPPPIQTRMCLNVLSARFDVLVKDRYAGPSPRHIQGQAALAPAGCDATARITPELRMNYIVRFTNADTVLPLYTDVVAVVNGIPTTSSGPIPAGSTIWMDLGPCTGVATYDFNISFIEPSSGESRTAYPEPPPFQALPGCEDSIRINLGGQS
jgi:hypothetical protein